MKIASLSTFDNQGGAARAAYRLHQGLKQIKVDSWVLSQSKFSQDPQVMGAKTSSGIEQAKTGLRLTLDQLPLKRYGQKTKQLFSPHWLPDKVTEQIAQLNPDLLNLHWVSAGYLKIETLSKFRQPLVWTLHDMWSFTGGCHYNQSCQKFSLACGACPLLGSSQEKDLSRQIWQRKQKAWANLNLTIVTPSRWLGDSAKASSLFGDRRVEVIPYGLDTTIFRPIEPAAARKLLKLPQDKQLVLFLSLNATSDQRKGFHLLQPALQKLSQSGWREKLELMVVGASQPETPPELGFKAHYLGMMRDDLTLALAYSAADVFVAPSIQDNLPNTVLEATACGTPSVAFDIGGMPDMIKHQHNGYLARPLVVEDLAQGLAWVLEDRQRQLTLAQAARAKAEQEFALEVQARRYHALYQEILAASS
ncbi:MAG: glycosyltransferase family 4 protein [Cyanobacteria bacterium P01_C01_bin.72]